MAAPRRGEAEWLHPEHGELNSSSPPPAPFPHAAEVNRRLCNVWEMRQSQQSRHIDRHVVVTVQWWCRNKRVQCF